MEVYSRPISIRYIPRIFICLFFLTISFIAKPVLAETSQALWIQVPQWEDDWSKCAVDVPDTACHWYVMAPDNTFGKGFSWKDAPWFDANGLKDIAKIQKNTVFFFMPATSFSPLASNQGASFQLKPLPKVLSGADTYQ